MSDFKGWIKNLGLKNPLSIKRKRGYKVKLNFIKIMKTCVNGNTLKLSLLQKWRGDVLVQQLNTCKAKTCFYWIHSNL